MKINKYIIGGLFAAFASASSCSLQYDPVDTYSDVTEGVKEDGKEAVFKDKAAVESYVTGMNNKYRDRQEHWYLDVLLIAEAHSDNAYAGTTGAEVVPYERNSIDGSNSVLARDWTRFLEDVAYANQLINFVGDVNELTAAEKASYRAQGLIFRSMIFFDMVRMWGAIPLVTTIAEDITADNIEEVYGAYFPDQATEEEAYRQIEKDLLDAIQDGAPATNPADKRLLSRDVAYALLAKVYAEKPIRDYAKVIEYCDKLAADGYGLCDNYGDLFDLNADGTDLAQRNTKESIYEAQFSTANGNWCTWMFGRDLGDWNSNFTWAKWVTPSRDLISAFEKAGDKVRYEESVVWYDCQWSNYYPSDNYAFMYKCRSKYNSLIKMRYADILLLKAEAKIMGDNPDLAGAATIINRVRNRVGLDPLPSSVTGSKEAMLDAYLNERRLELAFEGQRWYDLVRLNKVEEVMNSVFAKDEGRLPQVYPYNEYSYLLPIPQSEIDANDKLDQNLGY